MHLPESGKECCGNRAEMPQKSHKKAWKRACNKKSFMLNWKSFIKTK
jgi:hypothetical protein